MSEILNYIIRKYLHAVCQKDIFTKILGMAKNIKLKHPEYVEGNVEVK